MSFAQADPSTEPLLTSSDTNTNASHQNSISVNGRSSSSSRRRSAGTGTRRPQAVADAAAAVEDAVDEVDIGADTESEWEREEREDRNRKRINSDSSSTSYKDEVDDDAKADISGRTIRGSNNNNIHSASHSHSHSNGASVISPPPPPPPAPLSSIAMSSSGSMSSMTSRRYSSGSASGRSYDPWADSSDAELGESSAGEEEEEEEELLDDRHKQSRGSVVGESIGGWPAAFRPRPTHAYTPSSESTSRLPPPPQITSSHMSTGERGRASTGGSGGERRSSSPTTTKSAPRPKANGYTADLKDKRFGVSAAGSSSSLRSRSPRRSMSSGGGARRHRGSRSGGSGGGASGPFSVVARLLARPVRTPRRAALFILVVIGLVLISAVTRSTKSETVSDATTTLRARSGGASKANKAGRWTESPRNVANSDAATAPSTRLAPRWVLGDWAERSWRAAKDSVAAKLPSRGGLGGAGVWRLRSDLNNKREPGEGTHEREIQRVLLQGPMAAEQCRFVSPVEAYHQALKRLRDRPTKRGAESSSTPVGRSRHVFSPTGHLIIDDSHDARHPIPQLLELGEKRWEEMLERQSTTLGEAVQEYRKRYGREPPKGFDIWWDFAMTHDLVLPDEYDRIHLDLAPFWALPRDEMRRRAQEVESVKETYTLVVKGGRVDVEISDESGLAWEGTRLRAADQASLVKSFARYLPDMRAVFSIHDHPQVYVSWARRSSLVELGLSGQHTKHLKESDNADVLWSRSCAPGSNLRRNATVDESRSLVYDSLEAADICANPYLLDLHGLTVEKHGPASHPRPHTSLLPLFSLAKTSVNSDILITPLDQFGNGAGEDPAWEDKPDNRLVWRGSTTGISWMDKDTPWRKSHRTRLHTFAQNRSTELLDVIVPEISGEDGSEHLAARHRKYAVGDLAEAFYDMRLAGDPLQCNKTDGTCDDMRREIDFAAFQSPDELNQYKFLFDVDGNGWSGRFRRLMSTNSVVLKAGIFTEWFQPHLIPWFMYIPTRLDYSDLPMILSFLRGPPDDPEAGFDEVAKALAVNGKCFVNRMFRVQDLQAYMFRLFLEYARLIAPEGEDMDFHYELEYENEDADMEVVKMGEDSASSTLSPPPTTTTTKAKQRQWAIETQHWRKFKGEHVKEGNSRGRRE